MAGEHQHLGALADGAKTIYDGVKEGNDQDIAAGSIKSVGGGLMIAGACTCQPELVLAGGAVYLGGVVTQNWQAISGGVESGAKDVASGVEDVGNDVASGAKTVTHDLNPMNW